MNDNCLTSRCSQSKWKRKDFRNEYSSSVPRFCVVLFLFGSLKAFAYLGETPDTQRKTVSQQPQKFLSKPLLTTDRHARLLGCLNKFRSKWVTSKQTGCFCQWRESRPWRRAKVIWRGFWVSMCVCLRELSQDASSAASRYLVPLTRQVFRVGCD